MPLRLLIVAGTSAALIALALHLRRGDAPLEGGAVGSLGAAEQPGGPGPEVPSVRVGPVIGSGPESIVGAVVDARGEPVVGATVSATPEGASDDAPAVAQAEADGSGRFQLRGLQAGPHVLSVGGSGAFATRYRYVDAPRAEIELVVTRRVSVFGTIAEQAAPAGSPAPAPDAAAAPASNASAAPPTGRLAVDARTGELTVALAGGGLAGSLTAPVAADGSFRFDDLVEGEYRVWAYRGARASPALVAPRFGPGPFPPLRLELGPAVIVRGRVIDGRTGRGLAAHVRLSPESGEEPARYAVTDSSDGRFAIEGVLPGRWRPEAHAPGYVATETLSFDVQSAGEVKVELWPGGALELLVVDGAGSPISGARVSLSGVDRAGSPLSVTPAAQRARALALAGESPVLGSTAEFIPRGELGVMTGPIPFPPGPNVLFGARGAEAEAGDIADVAPARFTTNADGRISIEGLAAARYTARVEHSDYAPAQSKPIRVALGESQTLRVALGRGVVVQGYVRDERDNPIAGATVTALSADEDAPAAVAISAVDGHYQLAPLSRRVTLRASAPGFATVSRELRLPVGSGRDRIEREENLALFSADRRLIGRVVDPLGMPAARARVSTGGRAVSADAGGRFEIEGVAAGNHELRIAQPGYPTLVATAVSDREQTYELAQGGGVSLDITVAPCRGGGARARVSGRGPSGNEPVTAVVVDGRGSLTGLAVGKWTLAIEADGYVAAQVSLPVPAGDGAGAISVRDFRIELERGATVAGTVRDRHGGRVHGAVVRVGELRATTDQDGRFRLANVATGDVTLKASHDGAEGELTVPLRPGDELVTLEILLE